MSLRLYPPLSRKPIRPSAARPAWRPSTRNVSSSPPAMVILLPRTSRASGVVMLMHTAEGVRTVERRAGAPHHLHFAQLVGRLRHAVPLLGSEERDREVAAVLQGEDPAVERGIESTGIHVEVVDSALHDVYARHARQRHRRLAGYRDVLQHLLRHHRDGGWGLGDPLRAAREAPSTTISPREITTASRAASAVTVLSASTTTCTSVGR